MKKFYALLMTCLLLVFLSVPQIVDAGVGHSRSGGSSRSSSRSSGGGSRSGGSSYHYYRSGYGSSSSSSTNSFEMGLVFLIVAGVFLVSIFKPRRITQKIQVQQTLVMILKRSIVELNTTHGPLVL